MGWYRASDNDTYSHHCIRRPVNQGPVPEKLPKIESPSSKASGLTAPDSMPNKPPRSERKQPPIDKTKHIYYEEIKTIIKLANSEESTIDFDKEVNLYLKKGWQAQEIKFTDRMLYASLKIKTKEIIDIDKD